MHWLGLLAFHRILLRKQTRYSLLLAAIRAQLALPRYSHLPRQMAAVLDDARSAVFDDIIY